MNATVGLHNVAVTCANSAWEDPCAGDFGERPPLFACDWVGQKANYTIGPMHATRRIDSFGGVQLGVAVMLTCPLVPDAPTLRSLFSSDFDGSPVKLRLVIRHGRTALTFAGEPNEDMITFSGMYESPPPPPAAPPPAPSSPVKCKEERGTISYKSNGPQTYTISKDVADVCKYVGFFVQGGAGGRSDGGLGALVKAWFPMSAMKSTSLKIFAAARGADANVYGGNGGGASAVIDAGCDHPERDCYYVVAGGGGGGSGCFGGNSAQNGNNGQSCGGGTGGGGGTSSGPGSGGGGSRRSGASGSGMHGGAGSSACGLSGTGQGGWGWASGGKDNGPCGDGAGGGGGGGWYGGGGGGGGSGGAAGGAGSSMALGTATALAYTSAGSRAAGSVQIFFCDQEPNSAAGC